MFLFREAVSMMVSHVLKFVDLPKTKKATNLENETLFFFLKKIKWLIYYMLRGYNKAKDAFLAEVTFNFEQISYIVSYIVSYIFWEGNAFVCNFEQVFEYSKPLPEVYHHRRIYELFSKKS